MRRIALVTSLAVAVVGFSATATARDEEPTTFTGSCQFEGSVKYPDEPLEAETQNVFEFVRATGPCSGQFGDETLEGDTVKLEFEGTGPLSCATGGSTRGSGVLKFRGQKLDFTYVETRPPGIAANFVLQGDNGGAAELAAMADFKGTQGQTAARKCAESTGDENGIRRIPLDFTLRSPSISG
jgi:hypothetical protein